METFDNIAARIHHRTGINLLGVMLLLFWALACASALNLQLASPVARWFALLGPWCITIVIDLLWRQFRNKGYGLSRFVYPFAGGAFAYVPVWMGLLALPLVVVILAAVHHG